MTIEWMMAVKVWKNIPSDSVSDHLSRTLEDASELHPKEVFTEQSRQLPLLQLFI